MSSTPLLDITSIDLDRVMISADRVGEINPQCGPMRQLDHVIWHSDDYEKALAIKHVTHEEFWVDYHIPGRPLMPGVLMIEAAAQLCSIMFQLRTDHPGFVGFTRCDNAVFRGQVVPGDTLELAMTSQKCNARRLITLNQGRVDGRLVFECKITGMIL